MSERSIVAHDNQHPPTSTYPLSQFNSLVLRRADFVVGKLVEFYGGKTNEITFDEFSHWYNSGGFGYAPWVELLDLKKWLITAPTPTPTPKPTPASTPKDNNDNNDNIELYSFDLPLPRLQKSIHVAIFPADVKLLQRVTRSTSLIDQTVVEVCINLIERSTEGMLSKESFDEYIRTLFPANQMSNEEVTETLAFLECLFSCFDFEDKNMVVVLDFASGFALLCGGNKSEKLKVAFDLMGGGSPLNYHNMSRFFRNFLSMLVGVTYPESAKHTPITFEIWSNQVEAITYWARLAASNMFKQGQKTVAFEDFAEWYSSGGFEIVPWIELLDLQKFFNLRSPNSTPSSTPNPNPTPTPTPTQTQTQNDTNGASVILESPILITEEDIDYVYRIVLGQTKLNELSPQELQEILFRFTEKEHMSHESFLTFLSKLVESLSGVDMTVDVKYMFSNLFQAYNFPNENEVSVVQLLVGLTVLCSGKKTSKLEFAFNLFDADQDGKLSELELFLFFRSFLVMIFSCTNTGLEMTNDERHRVTTQTALAVKNSVIAFSSSNGEGSSVSFDEFGEWYNIGGYQMADFLELLDIKKVVASWADQEEEEEEEEDSSEEPFLAAEEDNDNDNRLPNGRFSGAPRH